MALAAINFIIIGESSIYTADFLLLPDGVTAASLQAYAIFLFYSLPSERDNCFFSSLDSMFNPPCAVSHSGVVLQTAEHCFFLQHATDILELPKQEWFPSSVAWLGLLSDGCDLTDTLGYRCSTVATATQQNQNHSPHAVP